MSEAIFWTIESNIKDGKRDDLEKFLAGAVEEVKMHEPTTLVYEFFLTEDDKTFTGLERYASSDAALAHLGRMGPKLGALMECFDGPPTIKVFGTISDELRGALGNFGAVISKPFGGFRR